MRASTILGLTAATLVIAADEDLYDKVKLQCFEESDSSCALASDLVEKCSSRNAKPEDSIECACSDYFTATSKCNTCLFEAAKKVEKENPKAAEALRSHVPYSVADSYEVAGDMIKAHEEKLCKQGKSPKLNFAEALDEVADEFMEKYSDELEMTVTMSETTTDSPASGKATGTADEAYTFSESTVTLSESGSAKSTVSVPESASSPSATPTGDNEETDGDDKKEDGEKEDGEKENGEDKVPESGAASLVAARIMVLAAGSALMALF